MVIFDESLVKTKSVVLVSYILVLYILKMSILMQVWFEPKQCYHFMLLVKVLVPYILKMSSFYFIDWWKSCPFAG